MTLNSNTVVVWYIKGYNLSRKDEILIETGYPVYI